MRNKATWIVFSTSILILGWIAFSRAQNDSPAPGTLNGSGSETTPNTNLVEAHAPGEIVSPGKNPETRLMNAKRSLRKSPPNPITPAIAKGPARFQMRSRNATTFFTSRGITTAIANARAAKREQARNDSPGSDEEAGSTDEPDGWAIHWELVGAREVEPEAAGEQEGTVNYYTGNETATGLPTYSSVEYEEVYDGVDLVVESRNNGVKYTLAVSPETDPGVIRMRYRGAESVQIAPGGENLTIETGVGTVEENELYVYQESPEGTRIPVHARYANLAQASGDLTWEYSIQVGHYNPELPLVIDPTITWSSYTGGTASEADTDEYGYGIAVSGTSIFVVGTTNSSLFPGTTVSGVYQSSYGDGSGVGLDAFVAKVKSNGSGIDWATYIGAIKSDYGNDIVIDGSGNPIIVGYTASTTAITSPIAAGNSSNDAFVIKFNGSTGAKIWGTYVGGSSNDYGRAIDLDDSGNIYIAGDTSSSGSNSIPGISGTYNSGRDAFVAKLDSSGTLLWSSYLGGAALEEAYGISVTGDGKKIGITGKTGNTSGTVFTTLNPAQGTYGGGTWDGFVAVFKESLVTVGTYDLAWSTYLGGGNYDYGRACDFDASTGDLNVVGYTNSGGLATGGLFSFPAGEYDVILAQYNSDTGASEWSTYFGGAENDYAYDLVTGTSGKIYITGELKGSTSSTNIPGTTGTFQPSYGSVYDGFVAQFSPDGTALDWAAYFGGTSTDEVWGIAEDGGYLYLTGRTNSSNMPSATNSLQSQEDAFVAKIQSDGSSLSWSMYLGGSESNLNEEEGTSIDVDSSGNIYIAGTTNTIDFVPNGINGPTGPINLGNPGPGGKADGFVMKISSSFSLAWATYFGGDGTDICEAIAVDSSVTPAKVYVAGSTNAASPGVSNFPIVGSSSANSWQTTYSGDTDGFLAKFDSSGSGSIDWSYFVGGDDHDYLKAVVLDASGYVYVGGYSTSDGSTAVNNGGIAGYTSALTGGYDIFVAKFDKTNASFEWIAVHGGDEIDYLYDIASGGDAIYATGATKSLNFASSGSSTTFGLGSYDAFVAKFSNTGTTVWAHYLGGSNYDYGNGIAADSSGNSYVTGYTGSQNLTSISTLPWGGGSTDAFLAQYDSSGSQTSFTYLGGSSYDYADEIDYYNGSVYLVGRTQSDDFPGSGSLNASGYDAYVSKIAPGTTPSVTWTFFVGGSGTEYGRGISVDSSGIYATGSTSSSNFPLNVAFNGTLSGSKDIFVVKMADSGATSQATISLTDSNGSTITDLSFNAQVGGASPATQSIILSNTGTADLNWQMTELGNAAWLDTTPVTSGTLVPAASVELTITVDTSSLTTAQIYTETLEFTGTNTSNSPQTITVTLDLGTNPPTIPTIGLSTTTLSFSAEESTVNPPEQSITITNTGSGTLDWTASAPTATWLSLSSSSGSLGAGLNEPIVFTVDISSLSNGTYSDSISISDPNATNNPQIISVLLEITAPSGGGSTTPAPGNDDDDKKNPLSCGASVAEQSGGNFIPPALAFLGFGMLLLFRRKF